jgi:hypothetical protein
MGEVQPSKILLYWPNIIGYLRLLLLAIAFGLFVETNPALFTTLYLLQALLDCQFQDGYAPSVSYCIYDVFRARWGCSTLLPADKCVWSLGRSAILFELNLVSTTACSWM